MPESEMKTFGEFWPFYVREHSRPATRALHAAGTLAGTALLVGLAATGRWRWLPLAFVPAYAAAWAGHFFIEHNRPATFKHPLWSFAGDYKMVALMLAGRMNEEVERAHGHETARGEVVSG
ncbi:MAG TPA: DUF962 domain-containing protein [Pyrinomonadaceae bacterium]